MSVHRSLTEETLDHFLDSAAAGDVATVTDMLSRAPALLNQRGRNHWTALMFAARNGHYDVAQTLLSHGCDKFCVNASSQTALDIAKFWGHRHVWVLLGGGGGGGGGGGSAPRWILPGVDSPSENYFSRDTLDRASGRRTDARWLEDRQKDAATVHLIFSDLSPMVHRPHGAQAQFKLCRFRYDQVKELIHKPDALLVFLGVERRNGAESGAEPGAEPRAWFAIGSDDGGGAELLKLSPEKNCLFPKSPNRDLLNLSEDEAGVVAQARALLAWHARYSFCATCGSATRPEEAGHKRSCLNPTCRSRTGVHNTCYPRVDPVVIMLVIHPDGEQCLLGRKKVFPPNMFSCLAGFVEPGESMEAAVSREVLEESGVQVCEVQYLSCQPWPMPSNLMLGCVAVATTTDIRVDGDEIEEARWFPRQQVMESLRGASPSFVTPPRQTIAHQLMRHWVGMNSNL